MRLDSIQKKTDNKAASTTKRSCEADNSILDLLNPLTSINLNSDLHSFFNYRETEKNVLELLRAQSNLIFYVLHQNFMIDEAHKSFFKNLIGRFYDLPEEFWDYYCGQNIITSNGQPAAIYRLVLLENHKLLERYENGDNRIGNHKFFISDQNEAINISQIKFNKDVVYNYTGKETKYSFVKNFYCSNYKGLCNEPSSSSYTFSNGYEWGRFNNSIQIDYFGRYNQENMWSKVSWDILEKSSISPEYLIRYKCVYASLGLENMDRIIEILKQKSGNNFKETWIPKFNEEDLKLIRSLSQTREWKKEDIIKNSDQFNLDVLALNLTVPWDIELVKFFIRKGYGARLSENIKVFENVFQPLLTDTILGQLFRSEYEKYI